MIEKVTQALVEALDAPKQNVRVWIHDVPKDWGIAGVSAKDLGRWARRRAKPPARRRHVCVLAQRSRDTGIVAPGR